MPYDYTYAEFAKRAKEAIAADRERLAAKEEEAQEAPAPPVPKTAPSELTLNEAFEGIAAFLRPLKQWDFDPGVRQRMDKINGFLVKAIPTPSLFPVRAPRNPWPR